MKYSTINNSGRLLSISIDTVRTKALGESCEVYKEIDTYSYCVHLLTYRRRHRNLKRSLDC